jgi:hypothetical protein
VADHPFAQCQGQFAQLLKCPSGRLDRAVDVREQVPGSVWRKRGGTRWGRGHHRERLVRPALGLAQLAHHLLDDRIDSGVIQHCVLLRLAIAPICHHPTSALL